MRKLIVDILSEMPYTESSETLAGKQLLATKPAGFLYPPYTHHFGTKPRWEGSMQQWATVGAATIAYRLPSHLGFVLFLLVVKWQDASNRLEL